MGHGNEIWDMEMAPLIGEIKCSREAVTTGGALFHLLYSLEHL